MEIPIVCVSKGRADRVTSLKWFPSAVLVVPPEEEDLYRQHNPTAEVVIEPPGCNLAQKRQWVWDEHEDVFMVDDDITGLVDLMAGPGEPSKVDPSLAEPLVQRTYHMAKQMGVAIFGFNPFDQPQGANEHHPFRLTGMVSASSTGLIGRSTTKLFWRPDLNLYDDFWLCLLNAYHNRTLLIDLRYSFSHKDTFHSSGGLGTYRREAALRDQFVLLKDAFGDAVMEKQASATKNTWSDGMAVVKVPF